MFISKMVNNLKSTIEKKKVDRVKLIESERIYSNTTDRIDLDPKIKDDLITIEIKDQEINFTFRMTGDDMIHSFELVGATGKDNRLKRVMVPGELILIPLANYCGVTIRDAIVHYKRGESFHLRTLRGQLHKYFNVRNNKFYPLSAEMSGGGWNMEITDHRFWSTS